MRQLWYEHVFAIIEQALHYFVPPHSDSFIYVSEGAITTSKHCPILPVSQPWLWLDAGTYATIVTSLGSGIAAQAACNGPAAAA